MTGAKPVLWCHYCHTPHSLDMDDSGWLCYGVVKTIEWPGDVDIEAGQFFMLCDRCGPLYVARDWGTLVDRAYTAGLIVARDPGWERRELASHWDRLADVSVPLEPEQVGAFRATFT